MEEASRRAIQYSELRSPKTKKSDQEESWLVTQTTNVAIATYLKCYPIVPLLVFQGITVKNHFCCEGLSHHWKMTLLATSVDFLVQVSRCAAV